MATSNRSGIPMPPKIIPTGPTEDEQVNNILSATLIPEHLLDPNIIAWIMAYLRSRDARQAADEIGIRRDSGPNLLRRRDIYEAIKKLTEMQVMKYGYDEEEIVARVKEIAVLDPIDFLKPDGSYKKLTEMRPEARRAIKKMKVKNYFETDINGIKEWKGEILEIELWDKQKSLELLGREKALFKETKVVQHTVADQMHALLLESETRAQERIEKMREVGPVAGSLPKPGGESG